MPAAPSTARATGANLLSFMHLILAIPVPEYVSLGRDRIAGNPELELPGCRAVARESGDTNEAMDREDASVGLCASCLHCRIVRTVRSTFYLCGLSFSNAWFPKYPALPVVQCCGYEPRPDSRAAGPDAPDF